MAKAAHFFWVCSLPKCHLRCSELQLCCFPFSQGHRGGLASLTRYELCLSFGEEYWPCVWREWFGDLSAPTTSHLWLCSHHPSCVAGEETATASLTLVAHRIIPGVTQMCGDCQSSWWVDRGDNLLATLLKYLPAESYLGHKLQLAPFPWISNWGWQRSWDFLVKVFTSLGRQKEGTAN